MPVDSRYYNFVVTFPETEGHGLKFEHTQKQRTIFFLTILFFYHLINALILKILCNSKDRTFCWFCCKSKLQLLYQVPE